MTWTAPRTFVAGELETATIFNTHLRDNLNALHDFDTGAQDIGANFLFSSGRSLSLGDAANVAHGMTTLAATSTYGALQKQSSTAGGLNVSGLSDTDSPGLDFNGYIGTTTPTNPAIVFNAAKKNGTGVQALAAGESAFWFLNNGSALGIWYGSGLDMIGGLNVGFSAVPTTGVLSIGDADFNMSLSGGVADIVFGHLGAVIQYTRASSSFQLLSPGELYLNPVGDLKFGNLIALGGGAAATLGTILGLGPGTAAQAGWMRFRDTAGNVSFFPVWR